MPSRVRTRSRPGYIVESCGDMAGLEDLLPHGPVFPGIISGEPLASPDGPHGTWSPMLPHVLCLLWCLQHQPYPSLPALSPITPESLTPIILSATHSPCPSCHPQPSATPMSLMLCSLLPFPGPHLVLCHPCHHVPPTTSPGHHRTAYTRFRAVFPLFPSSSPAAQDCVPSAIPVPVPAPHLGAQSFCLPWPL